jgi:hypothetical protein
LTKLTAQLPPVAADAVERSAPAGTVPVNFAVNNDGTYYPRVSASFTADRTSVSKVVDGNYWYHVDPPNRWTTEGSTSASDWVAIDFGVKRPVHTVKLYLLDDGERVAAPAKFDLEFWDGSNWAPIPGQHRTPEAPVGHRPNVVRFPEIQAQKLRAVFTHGPHGRTGLTEFEAWGDAKLPVEPAPAPAGNLAFNSGNKPFPKASASFTSRFDKVAAANDGVVSFSPEPHNRWTSYESPNPTDWIEIDFGREQRVARVELAIYDDRGGVQPPADYAVQLWTGSDWRDAAGQKKDPPRPAGGQFNEVRFDPAKTSKLRVVFTHAGKARSGVSEILVWPE